MQLSNREIKFLINNIERHDKSCRGNDWVARDVMRQESAILLLNMAGWLWSWQKMNAYKRKTVEGKETWEWFDGT